MSEPRIKFNQFVVGPLVSAPQDIYDSQPRHRKELWDSSYTHTYARSYEELSSQEGNFVNTNRVFHLKVKTKPLGGCFDTIPNGRHVYYVDYDKGVVGNALYNAVGVSGTHDATTAWRPATWPGGVISPDIDSLVEDQVNTAWPRINMVNTILELKDIPELFTKIPAGSSRAAADVWLRGKLGVIPSIQDIINGNFAKKYKIVYDELRRRAANEGVTVRKTTVVPYDSGRSSTAYGGFMEIVGSWTVSWYAKVNFGLPPVEPSDIFDFSVGAINAWEASPLSFVVDYFIPVGSFLSGISFENLSIIDQGISSKAKFSYITGRNGKSLFRSDITQYYRNGTLWANPDGIRTDFDEAFKPLSPQRGATLAALARSFS